MQVHLFRELLPRHIVDATSLWLGRGHLGGRHHVICKYFFERTEEVKQRQETKLLLSLLALLEKRFEKKDEAVSQNKIQELVCTIWLSMLSLPTISLDNQILSDPERLQDNEALSGGLTCSWGLILLTSVQEGLHRGKTEHEKNWHPWVKLENLCSHWIKFIRGKIGFFCSLSYKNLDR